MKTILTLSALLIFISTAMAQPDAALIFKEPAKHFTASAPLGNGRLGAMVFGNPNKERIVLNEISMWSGGIEDPNNYESYKHLPEIQNMLLEGKNIEAQKLLQKHFVCANKGSAYGTGANDKYGCYQVLGDLFINWKDTVNNISNYKHTLQVDSAISTTTWKRNGVQYKQQLIVSAPQQAIIIRLSADKKAKLSFSTDISRRERADIEASGNQIKMHGMLNGGAGDAGIQYAAITKVLHSGGKISTSETSIQVDGADECIIIIAARTNMNWPNVEERGAAPMPVAQADIDKAGSMAWNALLFNHVKEYGSYFNRSQINFTANAKVYGDSVSRLSTKQRLIRLKEGHTDPALISLYYNYGRYLLISSSRQGNLPANLQGLWAEEYQTPWNGDYHLNINLQMNYWPAEITNLSDLHKPYFDMIEQMSRYGKATAKAYYNSEGWTAHMMTNPWGFTAPGEHASWGSSLTGGCWSATHLWQHYLYTRDKVFLKQYYPVLKSSAKFYTDILIEELKHKWLVTAPSNSPENTYVLPNGQKGQTCMGPTMDMQIGRELLGAVIEASIILDIDADERAELIKIKDRLAPNQISPSNGGVQEWLEDYKEGEPQHRHVSHLYGLYPYDEITPWDTPEMAKAAKTTLVLRGDGGTGWSRAWKIAFWARLGDGNHAYKMLRELLNPVDPTDNDRKNGAGTYPNLFDAHPPFQIDGNFGATAGIAEMLIQSHGKDEVIRFLPALPTHPSFSAGKTNGLCARGDFVVDFEWESGEIVNAIIKSNAGGVCKLNLPASAYKLTDKNGKAIKITAKQTGSYLSFDTDKGAEYYISIK